MVIEINFIPRERGMIPHPYESGISETNSCALRLFDGSIVQRRARKNASPYSSSASGECQRGGARQSAYLWGAEDGRSETKQKPTRSSSEGGRH